MLVLVINAGSSSIKFQLFNMEDESCQVRGLVDRIHSSESYLSYTVTNQGQLGKPLGAVDYYQALERIVASLTEPTAGVLHDVTEISAVGHRVVHGGEEFVASTLITDEVEKAIERCAELAPLHNPPNLMGIRASRRLLPDIPQVAVFDTAFHQTLPEHAFCYAIPYELYRQLGVRRYGFHGTSFRYVCGRVAELMGQPLASLNLVACHLGNGCSIAAVREGKCIDTSMGLTPLEGLVMGTRAGDIDPALPAFLTEKLGINLSEAMDLLNRRSGLLGLSGLSSDVRDLERAMSQGDHRAQLALKVYGYRVRKYIGAYAAALGGLDAVVFTGGVGENSAWVRAEACTGLEFLGLVLDAQRNRQGDPERFIHAAGARVQVWIVPTNEELMIARDTAQIARRHHH
ncbi:MAG: acetate kinase [Abditibacteriales bacterium]|nr:acetate kinase [Abditibacteriales bacterium]MDW8365168.1 acetate kinase [Abditibacteriales bacterium]